MEKLTMNVKELAERMGISKPKAYELVRRRDFPAVWIGRRVVVPIDGFMRWLEDEAARENSARLRDVKNKYKI